MKSSKILLNICSVICFVYGALYIFSLVFIPIGIYCFIAGRRFSHKAEHINDIYSIKKEVFRNYVIFTCIACFPLGLLSIIPYKLLTGHNVKITTTETVTENVTKEENSDYDFVSDTKEPEKEHIETEEEKQEKFEKLKNFRDKGIITDEELEQAREQLFGDKK